MASWRASLLVLGAAAVLLPVCGGDSSPADPSGTSSASTGGGGAATTTTTSGAAGSGGTSTSSSATTGSGGSGGTAPDPACDLPAQIASAGSCIPSGSGGMAPYPVNCNPVTGESCSAGEVCAPIFGNDWGDIVSFDCVAITADAAVCDACDATDGPWCGNTLTCFDSSCRRFCCETADCGIFPAVECRKTRGSGTNPIFEGLPGLGVCLPPDS